MESILPVRARDSHTPKCRGAREEGRALSRARSKRAAEGRRGLEERRDEGCALRLTRCCRTTEIRGTLEASYEERWDCRPVLRYPKAELC